VEDFTRLNDTGGVAKNVATEQKRLRLGREEERSTNIKNYHYEACKVDSRNLSCIKTGGALDHDGLFVVKAIKEAFKICLFRSPFSQCMNSGPRPEGHLIQPVCEMRMDWSVSLCR